MREEEDEQKSGMNVDGDVLLSTYGKRPFCIGQLEFEVPLLFIKK